LVPSGEVRRARSDIVRSDGLAAGMTRNLCRPIIETRMKGGDLPANCDGQRMGSMLCLAMRLMVFMKGEGHVKFVY